MKRRAERTYFNTEYMPELYEDAIERNDQLKDGYRYLDIDFVIHEDRQRFYKMCRKHGYDPKTIKNESRRKHPDF